MQLVVYGPTKCTHCKQYPIYVFPEMKLRSSCLVLNSYIHVSVSDLHIPHDRSTHFAAAKSVDRSGAMNWASEGVLRVKQGDRDIQKQFTHRGVGGPDKYKFTGLHYTALSADANPYGKGCIKNCVHIRNLFIVKYNQLFILWIILSAGFGHGDGATAHFISSNQR
jgi:hypothetical protein